MRDLGSEFRASQGQGAETGAPQGLPPLVVFAAQTEAWSNFDELNALTAQHVIAAGRLIRRIGDKSFAQACEWALQHVREEEQRAATVRILSDLKLSVDEPKSDLLPTALDLAKSEVRELSSLVQHARKALNSTLGFIGQALDEHVFEYCRVLPLDQYDGAIRGLTAALAIMPESEMYHPEPGKLPGKWSGQGMLLAGNRVMVAARDLARMLVDQNSDEEQRSAAFCTLAREYHEFLTRYLGNATHWGDSAEARKLLVERTEQLRAPLFHAPALVSALMMAAPHGPELHRERVYALVERDLIATAEREAAELAERKRADEARAAAAAAAALAAAAATAQSEPVAAEPAEEPVAPPRPSKELFTAEEKAELLKLTLDDFFAMDGAAIDAALAGGVSYDNVDRLTQGLLTLFPSDLGTTARNICRGNPALAYLSRDAEACTAYLTELARVYQRVFEADLAGSEQFSIERNAARYGSAAGLAAIERLLDLSTVFDGRAEVAANVMQAHPQLAAAPRADYETWRGELRKTLGYLREHGCTNYPEFRPDICPESFGDARSLQRMRVKVDLGRDGFPREELALGLLEAVRRAELSGSRQLFVPPTLSAPDEMNRYYAILRARGAFDDARGYRLLYPVSSEQIARAVQWVRENTSTDMPENAEVYRPDLSAFEGRRDSGLGAPARSPTHAAKASAHRRRLS